MTIGQGKYDSECTLVREATHAEAAVVVVINGDRGAGFSVQGHADATPLLPDLLEVVVKQMRADLPPPAGVRGTSKAFPNLTTLLPQLAEKLKRMRSLLVELRTARPLLLYGDDWIARINAELNDDSNDNADPMTDHHTAAFALLTLGKALGLLDRDDIRSTVLDAVRGGSLSPSYLMRLRDRLNDVLKDSGAETSEARQ